MIEIYIINGSTAYMPEVLSGVKWSMSRRGEPSSLKFTCLADATLNIANGNAVKMIVDGKNAFFGFIFSIKQGKADQLEITAYDQMRYLKNKDSYIYVNKRADQVISMIAQDFNLKAGALANTGYVIGKKAEDNKTLFDIIQEALDDTLRNTGNLFVFYDDFGSLTLKNVEDLILDILIDDETTQGFTYSSSINENTYNQIKLAYDNSKTGKREVFIAKDSANISQWGVLQYYEKLQDPQGASSKANALLKLYDSETRTLKLSGCFGDVRARAGFSVGVSIQLGSLIVKNLMMIEQVTHSFENGLHTMDLVLKGGAINA